MVQILPIPTNLGSQIGQALGQGLQQGGQLGLQRGLLQNALKGLENLPKNSSPLQLASQLLQSTAGIPGSERYVGQLFPLLLQQMQNQAAFPSETPQGGTIPQSNVQGENPLQLGGEQRGGLLNSYLPEDKINASAENYAKQTLTGLQGYEMKRNQLLAQNANIEKQRDLVENAFLKAGGNAENWPLFQQIASKVPGNTGEEIYRNARPLFKKYENLTDSLENFSYPGLFRKDSREGVLKNLQGTVKNLVDLGYEDKARETLAKKGLSPTEISELVHPYAPKVTMGLNKIPDNWDRKMSDDVKDKDIKKFLQENTDPSLSLLGIRQKLWDKGYDWQRIAGIMREVYDSENAPPLQPEQINELSIVEKEPPRKSLAYLFQDLGRIFNVVKGQK